MSDLGINPDARNLAYQGLVNQGQTPAGKKVKKNKPVFRSIFEDSKKIDFESETALLSKEDFDREVESLLDAVHSEGDRLKDDPTFDNIKLYKDAVRKFMSFVVRNSFDTKEAVSGFNILNRKKHTIVVLVDGKLEQLAAGLLRGQKEQIDILRRLEEISGLLVDLMQ